MVGINPDLLRFGKFSELSSQKVRTAGTAGHTKRARMNRRTVREPRHSGCPRALSG